MYAPHLVYIIQTPFHCINLVTLTVALSRVPLADEILADCFKNFYTMTAPGIEMAVSRASLHESILAFQIFGSAKTCAICELR